MIRRQNMFVIRRKCDKRIKQTHQNTEDQKKQKNRTMGRQPRCYHISDGLLFWFGGFSPVTGNWEMFRPPPFSSIQVHIRSSCYFPPLVYRTSPGPLSHPANNIYQQAHRPCLTTLIQFLIFAKLRPLQPSTEAIP